MARRSGKKDGGGFGFEGSRVKLALYAAVPLVLAVMAIPGLFGSEEVAPIVFDPNKPLVLIREGPPKAAPKPASRRSDPPPEAKPVMGSLERAKPVAAAFPVSEDGDLVLEVSFRWDTFAHGASVPATVRFGNTSPKEFHLPASGEPHPTLSLVVLDSEGREVRRVVESSVDPYPRRTAWLAPGAALDVPIRVVDLEDAPLPAGEYTVYAEFRPDPAWTRLGLNFWSAPHGPVRSAQESFTVLARTE